MNDYANIDNESRFLAWCEWRKWCSILRVKAPCPTPDEIEHGLTDDLPEITSGLPESERKGKCAEKRQELFRYLAITRIKKSAESWLNSRGFLWDDVFFDEFDKYMKQPYEQTGQETRSYNSTYKDYIFYKVETSDDPPMKV